MRPGRALTRSPLASLLLADPTAGGARLHTALWTSPALDVLTTYQCGWTDGGCLILADALKLMLPSAQLAAVIDGPVNTRQTPAPAAQHVLVKLGWQASISPPWLLDSDGASTQQQLRDRWRTHERLTTPNVVSLDRASLHPETPRDAARSHQLARLLATTPA